MKVSLLSNETNSQDPLAVHSRIFVGNLNTFQCSKSDVEQIFQRYGHLTAISMHKGYAFVQFSNPVEAKNAADGEDGRLVLNQNIDVNLVTQPKNHQQVATKHVYQNTTNSSSMLSSSSSSIAAAAAVSSLNFSSARFQHLMVNGASSTVASSGVGGGQAPGGGVIQPKLSVSIQKRRKRRHRHQQLNRMRTDFLLDTSTPTNNNNLRLSSGTGNLMLMANHHFSGISPTLSSSSSSSASTSSLESGTGSQVPGEFHSNSFRTATGQPQQWYTPGYCANAGLNINNNYLIPTPVYDVLPNEVIDDPTQQFAQQNQAMVVGEEDSQEVMLYDGNNNPVSSWEEFILTTNKSGPDRVDILICGNCRELFNGVEQLLEHRRTTCQLRVFCECRTTTQMTTEKVQATSTACNPAENTILFCRMCRKQFSHPLALLQHVQHVHQIKIFETEHDYTQDKDLVAQQQQQSDDSTSSGAAQAGNGMPMVEVE